MSAVGDIMHSAALLWSMLTALLVLPSSSAQTVGFEQARYVVLEGDSVEVCIAVMTGSFASPATFNLLAADIPLSTDPAMEGSDYSLQGGSLAGAGTEVVLSSTATRGCIIIDTINDQTPEPRESLTIQLIYDEDNTEMVLANVTLSVNMTMVVILDNTAEAVGFEQARYTVLEGESVQVCISVMAGILISPATFILFILPSADTAVEDSDYSLQEGSLTNGSAIVVLNSRATRGCIGIDTLNDQTPEQMEVLRFGLASFDEVSIVNPNQTVVVILDNTAVAVGFEQARYTVLEGESVQVCITVMAGTLISPATFILFTIPMSADAAVEDSDFRLQEGTLTNGRAIVVLNSTATRRCIGIDTLNDRTPEQMEVLIFGLASSDEVSIVNVNLNHTVVVILDNTANCSERMFLCISENKCIAESLRCDGIPDCANGLDEQSCEVCTDGVRLSGGTSPMDGVVDVCVDGIYSSVCDSGTSWWSVAEASVVCRQLGFPTGGYPLSFPLLAAFGVPLNIALSSSQPIEVTCNGTEDRIQQCRIARCSQRTAGTIAGVNCTVPQDCEDGELRLVGGPSNREGRVEMCYMGVWGAISDDQWNEYHAVVTCRQLGFEPSGAFPISPAVYGGTPAPILFERLDCAVFGGLQVDGSEDGLLEGELQDRLIDCRFESFALTPVASPPRLVGVRCDDYQRTGCTDGDVRLTYRRTDSSGQVEVCGRNTWGTICSDAAWGIPEANVVCGQLGFEPCTDFEPRLVETNFNLPFFVFGSPIKRPVPLGNLGCTGMEQNLLSCRRNPCIDDVCDRISEDPCINDAAVTCGALPRIILEPPSSDGTYTVVAGSSFILSCEVGIYSYPGVGMPISVFRVVGNMTVPLIEDVLPSVNGAGLLGNQDQRFIERFIVLRSTNIRPEDAGEYRCVVNNTAGQQTVVNITVNVQVPDQVGSASIRLSVPSLERVGNGITAQTIINTTNNLVLRVVSDAPGTNVNCSYVASQEIDIQRGLERIECTITNSLPLVDVDAIAQRASAIITGTNPVYVLPVVSETGFCDAEVTEFLFWPDTPAGTIQTLSCPNTTTTIDRSCSLSGEWGEVDLSLCTPFSSINTDITAENYDETITAVSGAVRGAATNEQEQTSSNLATVTVVFVRSAALITANMPIVIRDATGRDLISIMEGLQQWNTDVLQQNVSNIVESFETIVSEFAQQERDGTFSFISDLENILLVAELVPLADLIINGRSFSSTGVTGSTIINNLNENETAAAFLPASLFQSITGRTEVGLFFAVYSTAELFPITNNVQIVPGTNETITTIVGSPVLGATVGPGLSFNNLAEPVRIFLRLNELENLTSGPPRCVSWNFALQEWTPAGCVTEVNQEGVVTCNCNHLTNFAVLVDICSRLQDCESDPVAEKALEVVTILGVVLSLIGIVATIFTLLFFRKLRQLDASKYHIQLCLALGCMLIVFVCGINRTSVYGGCVVVSILIHYFTLAAVMWMGAEAVLMFQKLVIVFVHISTKFIITVSLVCWLVPIIPVVIPLAVDLSDAVSTDLLVRQPAANITEGFCFISDVGVFFGAFLGPIFVILLFNTVIFAVVIGVLIKHTYRKTPGYKKEQFNKKKAIKLLISIAGVMFLFGLTWLFGALTVTGLGDSRALTTFQAFFVILNAFQGFFLFLFFCVFNQKARESWLEVFCRGRYKSKFLHPSQGKPSSAGTSAPQKKINTASTNLDNSNHNTSALSNQNGFSSSADYLIMNDQHSEIPLTTTAEGGKTKPKMDESPELEVHETNVDKNKKVEKEEGQMLETAGSTDTEKHVSRSPLRVDGAELKVRLNRYSTQKAYKHHIESAEVDFSENDSDGNTEPDS